MDKERLQLAMDISEHGFWDWNLDTGDAYFSPTYYTMLGYEPGEFPPGYQSWFDLLHPEDQAAVAPRIREAVAQARPYEEEFRLKCKDGRWKWICGKGKTYGLDNEGVSHRAAGLHIDIDEKKRAGELVQEAEKQYRSIFENAVEGIYQSTPAGTFHSVNPAFARILGYESPEELIGSVTDITAQLYVNPESRRELIRSVEEKGFVASHPVQLYRKDRSIAWLSISARPVQNEQGKLIYLEGIVEDITELKRVEEELRVSVERLRRVTGSVIEVIVQAVEVRDPYTAGHQKRAADLARAVASEMRLPPDRIAGIRTAAVIHDLGKISIPAEILSMPRKLTDIEYQLVMEHAQIGYNILKEIEFEWPVADIVHQHHERMDGSGYPQGLKGEEIMLEARILAVADVVEAIATHRPYRPACGIDRAIAEITARRGALYDPDVVDACLRLFRERGYHLPEY